MQKLLFLIVITVVNLNAGEWYINEFPIYVQGDTNYISNMLNNAAMLTNDTEFLKLTAIAIFFMIGMSVWKIIKGDTLSNLAKTTATIIATLTLLFSPSEVHLVDTRVDNGYILGSTKCGGSTPYKRIDNVPWVVALPASVSTTIGYQLKKIIAAVTAGTNIEKISSSKIGNGTLSKIIENIHLYSSVDTLTNAVAKKTVSNIKSYLTVCAYPAIKDDGLEKLYMQPRAEYFEKFSPSELHIDGAYASSYHYNSSTTCEAFWNTNIEPNLANLKTEMLNQAERYFECIDPRVIAESLENAGLISMTINNGAPTALTKLASYITNAGAQEMIISSVDKAGGVELANRLTAEKSLAKVQMEGAGQYNFFTQILPNSMHFLFGYVLIFGVFVAIFAMSRPYEQSIVIISTYMLGFFVFQIIDISIVIVNDAVLFYESFKAADKLALLNGNGASIGSISNAIKYNATMTAVSGAIGTVIILASAKAITTGDILGFMSGLSAPAQKYMGNDVQIANNNVAEKRATEQTVKSIMNNEKAAKYFSDRGIEIPKGRGELEYYNSFMQNVNSMSAGMGNASMSNKVEDLASGITTQTNQKLSQTAGYGSTADMAAVSRVSVVDGKLQASTANQTDTIYEKKKLGSKESIEKAGFGNAAANASKIASAHGATDAINNDSNGIDDYLSGSEMDGRVNANKTIAKGEKWEKSNQSDLMKKVKQNEKVGTFGSIESTNAEIQKHTTGNEKNSVNQAIADMITTAQEKGVQSNEHSNNMRSKFGNNLEKEDNNLKTTFRETSKALDNKKIDEMHGTGVGVMANKNVDYAKVAAVTESRKGQGAQDLLNKEIKIAGEGKDLSDSMSDLAKSIEKLAQTSGTQGAAQTASAIAAIKTRGEDGYIEASKKSGIEASAKLGAQFDNTKAVLSKKLGREATSEEIHNELAYENRTNEGIKAIPARTGLGIKDIYETVTGRSLSDDGVVGSAVASAVVGLSEFKSGGNGIVGKPLKKSVKGLSLASEKITNKLRGVVEETFENTDNNTDNGSKNNTSPNENSNPNNNPSNNSEIIQDEPPKRNNTGQTTSARPAHVESIAESKSNINLKNAAGSLLKVAGVAETVNEMGGAAFNVFSAVQKAGQDYYKTGNFDLSGVGDSIVGVPMTALNAGLDGLNTGLSAVTAAAITPFNNKSFVENFNNSFDGNSKDYSSITAQSANSMYNQMNGKQPLINSQEENEHTKGHMEAIQTSTPKLNNKKEINVVPTEKNDYYNSQEENEHTKGHMEAIQTSTPKLNNKKEINVVPTEKNDYYYNDQGNNHTGVISSTQMNIGQNNDSIQSSLMMSAIDQNKFIAQNNGAPGAGWSETNIIVDEGSIMDKLQQVKQGEIAQNSEETKIITSQVSTDVARSITTMNEQFEQVSKNSEIHAHKDKRKIRKIVNASLNS